MKKSDKNTLMSLDDFIEHLDILNTTFFNPQGLTIAFEKSKDGLVKFHISKGEDKTVQHRLSFIIQPSTEEHSVGKFIGAQFKIAW